MKVMPDLNNVRQLTRYRRIEGGSHVRQGTPEAILLKAATAALFGRRFRS